VISEKAKQLEGKVTFVGRATCLNQFGALKLANVHDVLRSYTQRGAGKARLL
jgi:hypothetical protein